MDKIKLDKNLFEVMEKITKEGKKKEILKNFSKLTLLVTNKKSKSKSTKTKMLLL